MYIAIFGECEWQTQKNHIGYCLISKEAAHAKFDAGKADFVFGTPWRSNNITDVPLTSFLRETDVEDYYMGSFYGVPKQEYVFSMENADTQMVVGYQHLATRVHSVPNWSFVRRIRPSQGLLVCMSVASS